MEVAIKSVTKKVTVNALAKMQKEIKVALAIQKTKNKQS